MTYYGTVHHPLWTAFLPHIPSDNITCKTVTYVCMLFLSHSLSHTHYDLSPSSPSCIVLDLTFSDGALCLVNFYHNVPDSSHGLTSLLAWDIDDSIPMIVAGDFNTHSPSWSMAYMTTSSWAAILEDWFNCSSLLLLSPPQVPTWISYEAQ
jgi:hypothetical protein